MKRRWLIGLLAVLMTVAMALGIVACGGDEVDNSQVALDAINTIRGLYQNNAVSTPDDYKVLGQTKVGDNVYTVTWSVSPDAAKQYVSVGTMDETTKLVTIDVTRTTEDVSYTLTASVTVGDVTKTVDFPHTIPKKSSETAQTATLDLSTKDNRKEFDTNNAVQVWSANGVTLTNSGNVADYAPIRLYKNTTTVIEMEGANIIHIDFHSAQGYSDSPYPDYLKQSLEASDLPIKGEIGVSEDGLVLSVDFEEPMESVTFTTSAGQCRLTSIDVEGNVRTHDHKWTYQHVDGTMTHVATCTADGCDIKTRTESCSPKLNVCACGYTYSATEILDALFALEKGKSLPGTYTLTGEVTKVTELDTTQYYNVTFDMEVEGRTITVYRAKGDYYADVEVGGTATVNGSLLDYNGTKEFTQGGAVVAFTPGVDTRTPQEKVNAALAALADTFTVTKAGDTDLPTSKVRGVEFTWTSTQTDYPVTQTKITVSALPAQDATVTATVTATCGTETVTNNTKTVTITIRAQSSATDGFTPITAPAAGSDYYLAMDINGVWYYSTGVKSGNYLGTTTDISKAVKVTLAASGSGWTLVTNGKYIELETSEPNSEGKTYVNIMLKDAQTTGRVWMWNTQYSVFTMEEGGETYFMGTYGTFNTFNSANISYIENDNEYIGRIGTYAGTVTPPTPSDADATLSFADKDANRTDFSTTKQVWKQNGITLTNEGSVGDYAGPVRLYKSSTVKIEYTSAMAQIVFHCGTYKDNDYPGTLQTSLSSITGITVTVDGLDVTVVLATPATSFEFTASAGQIRLDSIDVYTKAGTVTPPGPGGETTENGFTPITEPQEGTYYIAMKAADNAYHYLTGSMGTGNSSYYMATVTAIGDAAQVTLAGNNTAGWTIVCNGKYIEIQKSADGKHTNAVYNDSQTAGKVWEWDDSAKLFYQTIDGEKYVLGTYGTFTTVGAITYEGDDYYVVLGTYKGSGTDTPTPSEGTTASVDISAYGTEHGWARGEKHESIEIDSNVSVTVTGGANSGNYYETDWRVYQTDNPKPTITFTAAKGFVIVSVKVSYNKNNNGILTSADGSVQYDNGEVITVAENLSSVSFTVGYTGTDGKNNGQVRITAIEVTYKEGTAQPGPGGDTETTTFSPMTDPQGGEYYIGMQAKGTWYYLTGEPTSTEYRLATTTDIKSAANFTLEAVTGGWIIKCGNKYLEIVKKGNYVNSLYRDTRTDACIWTWNSEYGILTVTVEGTVYYLGSYDNYTQNMSASKISFLAGSPDTQYPAHLGTTVSPEDAAAAIAAAKAALQKDYTNKLITEAGELELPASLNGATITYAVKTGSASYVTVDGNKLTIVKLGEMSSVSVVLTATIKSGSLSEDVELTFTIAQHDGNDGSIGYPYTTEEAIAIALGGSTKLVHVTGYIIKLGAFDEATQSFSGVWMSSSPNASQYSDGSIEITRLYLSDVLAMKGDLSLGSAVVVCGYLGINNGSAKLGTGSDAAYPYAKSYTDARSDSEKVAAALAEVVKSFTFKREGSVTLPTATVSGVELVWTSRDASFPISVKNGVYTLTIAALPQKDVALQLTVKAVLGGATSTTRLVQSTVKAVPAQPNGSLVLTADALFYNVPEGAADSAYNGAHTVKDYTITTSNVFVKAGFEEYFTMRNNATLTLNTAAFKSFTFSVLSPVALTASNAPTVTVAGKTPNLTCNIARVRSMFIDGKEYTLYTLTYINDKEEESATATQNYTIKSILDGELYVETATFVEGLPYVTDETKVENELTSVKEALAAALQPSGEYAFSVTEDGATITLPVSATKWTNVTYTWASSNADYTVAADGKFTVKALPAEATSVTLTLTISLGSTRATVRVLISIAAAPEGSLQIPYSVENLLKAGADLGANETLTEDAIYVKAQISSLGEYDAARKVWKNVVLRDIEKAAVTLTVTELAAGDYLQNDLYVDATLILSGWLTNAVAEEKTSLVLTSNNGVLPAIADYTDGRTAQQKVAAALAALNGTVLDTVRSAYTLTPTVTGVTFTFTVEKESDKDVPDLTASGNTLTPHPQKRGENEKDWWKTGISVTLTATYGEEELTENTRSYAGIRVPMEGMNSGTEASPYTIEQAKTLTNYNDEGLYSENGVVVPVHVKGYVKADQNVAEGKFANVSLVDWDGDEKTWSPNADKALTITTLGLGTYTELTELKAKDTLVVYGYLSASGLVENGQDAAHIVLHTPYDTDTLNFNSAKDELAKQQTIYTQTGMFELPTELVSRAVSATWAIEGEFDNTIVELANKNQLTIKKLPTTADVTVTLEATLTIVGKDDAPTETFKLVITIAAEGSGSKDDPLTVEQALAIMNGLEVGKVYGGDTPIEVYVEGYIIETGSWNGTYWSNVKLGSSKDATAETGYIATIYSINPNTVVKLENDIAVGGKLTVRGYLRNYDSSGLTIGSGGGGKYAYIHAYEDPRSDIEKAQDALAELGSGMTVKTEGDYQLVVESKTVSGVTFVWTVPSSTYYTYDAATGKVTVSSIPQNNDEIFTFTVQAKCNNTTLTAVNYTFTIKMPNNGTKTHPYTANEAIAEAKKLTSGSNVSEKALYVNGVITKIGDWNEGGKYWSNVYISDDNTETGPMAIAKNEDGFLISTLSAEGFMSKEDLYVGSKITVYGYLKFDSDTSKMATANGTYPTITTYRDIRSEKDKLEQMLDLAEKTLGQKVVSADYNSVKLVASTITGITLSYTIDGGGYSGTYDIQHKDEVYSLTIRITATNENGREMTREVTLTIAKEIVDDPNVLRFAFAKAPEATGTNLNAGTATELFTKALGDGQAKNDFASVSVTSVANGNGTGGVLPSTAGMLKMGASGKAGDIVLTLNRVATSVTLTVHDYYEAGNSKAAQTISVNGSSEQTLPRNETGYGEDLVFDLSEKPSMVVKIHSSERALIYAIAITLTGDEDTMNAAKANDVIAELPDELVVSEVGNYELPTTSVEDVTLEYSVPEGSTYTITEDKLELSVPGLPDKQDTIIVTVKAKCGAKECSKEIKITINAKGAAIELYKLDATVQGTNQAYANSCVIESNNVRWDVNGNTKGVSEWRFGGKKANKDASPVDANRTLKSKAAISGKVTEIRLTLTDSNKILKSVTLNIYSSDPTADPTPTAVKTFKEEFTDQATEREFTFKAENGQSWNDYYYVFIFHVYNDTTSTKYVAISNLQFMGTPNA